MGKMTRFAQTAVVVALVVICAAAAWSAEIPNPYSSTLSGSGTSSLGSFVLNAAVTESGGMFHYDYTLYFQNAIRPLTTFSIGNTSHFEFYNAGNDQTAYFTVNPVYDAGNPGQNSVIWNATSPMPSGTTIKFWFDSPYPYGIVPATVSGGGKVSTGDTLGMVIPEPGTLIGICLGLSGVGMAALRKFRKR